MRASVSRWRWVLCTTGMPALLVLAGCPARQHGGAGHTSEATAYDMARESAGQRIHVPRRLGFEANQGQWSPAGIAPVRFAARDEAGHLFLTPGGALWSSSSPSDPGGVRMRWVGGDPEAEIAGHEPLPGHVNHFRGREAARWRRNVPLYGRVLYREVYRGVDVVFHDAHGRIEYDFVVSPGADPKNIRIAFDGVRSAALDEHGNLRLRGASAELTHHQPLAYQDRNGKRQIIPARYALQPPLDQEGSAVEVTIALGSYDANRPLIIDPTIVYTTGIGITNTLDALADIAVDGTGNLWLAGITRTDSLPVTGDAIDPTFAEQEGFVIKLDPEGRLVYATYLGGSSPFDVIGNIDVDRDGNVYVAGVTISEDFPVTGDAWQGSIANPGLALFDAFLVKLDANGALLYSTYYGGTSSDHFSGGSEGEPAAAVAVSADGSVFLAGTTISPDFPVEKAHQPGPAREFSADGFLVKFSPDFDREYATYFGGLNHDYVYRVAVDGAGDPYLFGCSFRTFGDVWSFPVTSEAFQKDSPADNVNFVAKFDAAGALVYSTLFGHTSGGGGQCDSEGDLAVDAAGHAYIVGATFSDHIPITPGAFQTQRRGFTDLFVAKLDPTGSALVYSTYFGGSGSEQEASNAQGVRIAVNEEGNAYVAAITSSADLPLENAFVTGTGSAFVAKLDANGAGLEYSSYVPVTAGPIGLGGGAVYLGGNDQSQPGIAAIKIDEEGGGPTCPGDCNGDGVVAVNELITGVGISLGESPVSGCPNFDRDSDGLVVVSELILAVRSALEGCA